MALVTFLGMVILLHQIAGRKMVGNKIIPAEQLRRIRIPAVVDRTKTGSHILLFICGKELLNKGRKALQKS